jgi:hypothetical protein
MFLPLISHTSTVYIKHILSVFSNLVTHSDCNLVAYHLSFNLKQFSQAYAFTYDHFSYCFTFAAFLYIGYFMLTRLL